MNAINHFGIAITLFAVLLLWGKQPRRVSDRILIFFLISLSLPLLMEFLGWAPTFQSHFSLAIPLSLGPFMFLYTQSLMRDDYTLLNVKILHFLPLLIGVVILSLSPRGRFLPEAGSMPDVMSMIELLFILSHLVSFSVYAVLIYQLLRRHKRRVLDHFAQTSNRISLQWLVWLVYLLFALFIFGHLLPLVDRSNVFPQAQMTFALITQLHSGGALFLIVGLGYFGIQQSPVFSQPTNVKHMGKPLTTTTETTEKADSRYESSRLTDADLDTYLEQIETYMKEEKPYLDSDLNLARLSELLDLPSKLVTETINRRLNKNFFNYVNDYRIAAVKQLLLDPENDSRTIISLAFDVGFNSKTTFNAMFKKSTEMTPTQYRKKFRP
jgi:AraC-like DNA-binding protein